MRIVSRMKFGWPALAALVLLLVGLTTAGPAGAAVNPDLRGHLDSATGSAGTISVRGWAADLATPHTVIDAAVTIDGQDFSATLAHDVRADIGQAYPALGDAHGFHEAITGIPGGTYTVCGYAIDPKGGPAAPIGCLRVTVPQDHPAAGHFDSLTALGGGRVQVTGWAADIDTPATPTSVAIYLGGGSSTAYKSVPTTANLTRNDVWKAFPALGPNHGFSVTTLARTGTQSVCVYAKDTYAFGAPTLLGCRTVTVS